MATFADIRNQVSKRLLDPNAIAVSSADVGQAINSSVSYWSFRRFWFNEVSDSATLTAQSGSFPYPSDFLVPATKDDGFNIEYSSMRYPLVKITQQEYDAMYLSNGYGIPRWYARMGDDQYQCYPLPDQNYTVNRHYLKNYVPLVNDGDENDFTTYAARLLVLWTCADLNAELRQDDKMEAYFRARAGDEYKNLRVMSNKSNSTDRLTLNSYLL